MVEVRLAGGFGFGDPHERTRSGVEDDVANGYVFQHAATVIYGAPASASAAE